MDNIGNPDSQNNDMNFPSYLPPLFTDYVVHHNTVIFLLQFKVDFSTKTIYDSVDTFKRKNIHYI